MIKLKISHTEWSCDFYFNRIGYGTGGMDVVVYDDGMLNGVGPICQLLDNVRP